MALLALGQGFESARDFKKVVKEVGVASKFLGLDSFYLCDKALES